MMLFRFVFIFLLIFFVGCPHVTVEGCDCDGNVNCGCTFNGIECDCIPGSGGCICVPINGCDCSDNINCDCLLNMITYITLSRVDLLYLNVGDTYLLYATVTPENANNQMVIWVPSDPAVISVTESMVQMKFGVSGPESAVRIKANAEGTATLTAIAISGNKEHRATLLITVVGGEGDSCNPSMECDICVVVRMVKAEHYTFEKQLENDQVSVRSYLDGFDITFCFVNVLQEQHGVYIIPFTVFCRRTTRSRTDFLYWYLRESKAGVLLSFDDWYPCWRERYYIFEHAGIAVTFFFFGSWEPRRSDAVFLHNKGHEIGWHTATHRNLSLLDPSSEEDLAIFDYETMGSFGALTNAGINISNFAYPFGAHADWTNERLSQRFHITRGFSRLGFYVYTADRLREGGFINSGSVDRIAFRGSHDFRITMRKRFLITKFMGGVIPIASHTIDYSGGDWSIMPHDLEYLIRVAKELKLNFYRFDDFLD